MKAITPVRGHSRSPVADNEHRLYITLHSLTFDLILTLTSLTFYLIRGNQCYGLGLGPCADHMSDLKGSPHHM